jgi:hypothetical protein
VTLTANRSSLRSDRRSKSPETTDRFLPKRLFDFSEIRTARGNDVHLLRELALQLADDVGVEAELQDGAGAGLAGELGVDDLVGPVAEVAGGIDAQEDVGAA